MEDSHTTILNLDGSETEKNAFFAVYDGHGGSNVAKFAGENLWKRLASETEYQEGHYDSALKKAFLGTDEDLRKHESFQNEPSGCTAVAALLTSSTIYVANAGDSRSIISVKGNAKPLSFDHKPLNESESSRITAAGGFIEYGRVNGNLALSRAIGDFEFKKNYSLAAERQIITADPDVTSHDLTEEDEFLVLACDGIWDCLSSQQVIDIVRRLVYEGMAITEICDKVIDICLAPDSTSHNGIGCDNMTFMVVALLNGRTKEEWYAWVKDRVEHQYGYETPEELPQIYMTNPRANPGMHFRLGPGSLNSIARALSGFEGIRFAQDDSDEESGEDEAHETPFLGSLRAPPQRDPTLSLRDQLEELEDEDMDAEYNGGSLEEVGGLVNKNLRQGDAPLVLGEKLTKPTFSEEPSGKAKGLMDTSETALQTK